METANVQIMQLEMTKLRREIGEEFDIRIAQVGPRVDDIDNRIDTTISEKLSTSERSFLGEQRRVSALVEEMRGALQAVDGANVERIGAEIKAQDGRDTVRTEFLQNMFRSEMNSVTRLIGELNGPRANAEARLGELERTQHLGSSQGAGKDEEGARKPSPFVCQTSRDGKYPPSRMERTGFTIGARTSKIKWGLSGCSST